MQTVTPIHPKYLDISFESVGIRDSQKRLHSLIAETAIQPLTEFEADLLNNFELVENIVRQRVAQVIAYWCEYKHDPIAPELHDMMSDITNASKKDVSIGEFYKTEVKNALHALAPTLGLSVPVAYDPPTDAFEAALNQIGSHQPELRSAKFDDDEFDDDDLDEFDDDDDLEPKEPYRRDTVFTPTRATENPLVKVVAVQTNVLPPMKPELMPAENKVTTQLNEFATYVEVAADVEKPVAEPERAIVAANPTPVIEIKDKALQDSVLTITTEEAWQLIYGLIGYRSEYIQGTMLVRWQQQPDAFDKDRRFLYGLFIETIRNAAGVQQISGNHTFVDRHVTLDKLWTHYYSDLAQNVAPQLAAAKLHNNANATWYQKLWQKFQQEAGNISVVWLVALGIALVLDALTTYISLDQTPMEGAMVVLFTLLITALFQIADQLVISYRKREFDAEAMSAKFHAQYERLLQEASKLAITSESYVQLSMNKSKAHSDWKAAEDNRRMARRGRFWSARIADINVVVTAYGFSFLFLNSREPMVAIVEQFEAIFVYNNLRAVDPWVFLMVGLAVTVSFVVNTAQRTEILGWSMRRFKREN